MRAFTLSDAVLFPFSNEPILMSSNPKIAGVLLLLVLLTACQPETIKRSLYQAGQQIGCAQQNKNLPDATQHDVDCITQPTQSYDAYEKQRQTIEQGE